jgi:methionyl-tRNA formyltransferase
MKVIFYGTSAVGLQTLRALAAAFEVSLVVTSPDAPVGRKQVVTPSPVSVLADELGIPTAKPDRVRGNLEFLKQLEELSVDIAVVVSYGKILPEDVLATPRLGTLNVHFCAR